MIHFPDPPPGKWKFHDVWFCLAIIAGLVAVGVAISIIA